jgi:hypothetical protein
VNTRHAKNTWAKQQKHPKKNDDKLYTDIRTLDATGLYAWCQSQYLPVNGFRWMDKKEILCINWAAQQLEQDVGYILEVTLDYPEHLHLWHNDYPLAPLHVNIEWGDLSPFAKKCKQTLDGTHSYKAKKLTSNFMRRENYVIHHANLSLYLSLGMVLVNVRRVLTFTQAKFMADFVNFCAEQRKRATSESRKSIFKLLPNSCYGKYIEQVRKRLDCRLVFTEPYMMHLFNKPNFKKFEILDNETAFCFLTKSTVKLNKCYSVGFTILELSKWLMFHTWYNKIKPFVNANLIMTDTDSLAIAFRVKASENVMQKIAHIMDFSNYQKDDPLFNETRKGELGSFKDEGAGYVLKEMVAIRSKVYCMKFNKNYTKITAKGVKKAYKKIIPFKSFLNCIKKIDSVSVTQYAIRSKSHNVMTHKMNRLAFSTFDDKRHLWDCSKHTTAYGSCLIPLYMNKIKCPFCYFK